MENLSHSSNTASVRPQSASSGLSIRALILNDLNFVDSVRTLAGWNQTREDWLRFIAAEPDGCFLAEIDRQPVGTATTTVYGPPLAWIGMVLVHPDYRRRGVGKALLNHCIDYLHSRGVNCIKLDATPAGKTVYDSLGFKDEWPLQRWARTSTSVAPSAVDDNLRPWCATDNLLAEALDRIAFGVARQKVISALARQSESALVFARDAHGLAGFGMLRSGAQAAYLGPVVAESDVAAQALVHALVMRHQEQTIFWDIPDANTTAISWAQKLGFAVQRPLVRMFLGPNVAAGDPKRQYALAGPEIG